MTERVGKGGAATAARSWGLLGFLREREIKQG